MQSVPFKADGHQISVELYQYTRDLLALGTYTLKQVAEITGLGKNTVKALDLKRLKELYTIDGTKLIRPEQPAKMLAIDEFKLHNGHRYATHIIDLDTGHILWISHGKKKQVVYDFIDHVGLEWMDSVEAVACDMNSDFQEAFEEKCPWIQPVFDYFHIVKNFNDKVVSEVRKDEQRRLYEEGLMEEARALKKTRYILMSSRSTLQAKDAQARTGEPISRSGSIFPKEEYVRKEGYEARYDELLSQNKLLFTLDLIKERLSLSYTRTDEARMADDITWIMDTCSASGNNHLQWFGILLGNHFEGIIAHATYKISSGKMEGINNKIKVLRRQAYGLPDKYAYVAANKNNQDGMTYNYLKDLIAAGYSDAHAIYDELYSWKATFTVLNYSADDKSTNYSSVDRFRTWVAHFVITGGSFEGSIPGSWRIDWPDGTVNAGDFDNSYAVGGDFYVYGWYNNPAFGTSGTVTVTLYAEGTEIGRTDFAIYLDFLY